MDAFRRRTTPVPETVTAGINLEPKPQLDYPTSPPLQSNVLPPSPPPALPHPPSWQRVTGGVSRGGSGSSFTLINVSSSSERHRAPHIFFHAAPSLIPALHTFIISPSLSLPHPPPPHSRIKKEKNLPYRPVLSVSRPLMHVEDNNSNTFLPSLLPHLFLFQLCYFLFPPPPPLLLLPLPSNRRTTTGCNQLIQTSVNQLLSCSSL